MTETPSRPSDVYSVKLKTENKEVFMSAALCQHLVKICEENTESISDIYTNLELQEALMVEVLRPRTNRGEPDGDFNLMMIDMPMSSAKELKNWILEHILYFFIDNAQTAKQGITGSAFLKLTELLVGSQVSPQENSSAGATDVEVVTQT